jgi:hypothetical protein
VALALRYDVCVGSEVLWSEVLRFVVVGVEVWHWVIFCCCQSSQDLLCLLMCVAKWGIVAGLCVFR